MVGVAGHRCGTSDKEWRFDGKFILRKLDVCHKFTIYIFVVFRSDSFLEPGSTGHVPFGYVYGNGKCLYEFNTTVGPARLMNSIEEELQKNLYQYIL